MRNALADDLDLPFEAAAQIGAVAGSGDLLLQTFQRRREVLRRGLTQHALDCLPRQQQPQQNFFNPFSQAPQERQADYSRAPAPRKSEGTPTTKIVVMGDSMADWLAYGLEDAFADAPEIGIVRKHRTYSGLLRYETRTETTWAQVAREVIAAEKTNFVVMMLGVGHDATLGARRLLDPAAWTGPTLLALVLAAELGYVLLGSGQGDVMGRRVVAAKEVGIVLFGPYLLAVELASLLLAAALVAAYHVGRHAQGE